MRQRFEPSGIKAFPNRGCFITSGFEQVPSGGLDLLLEFIYFVGKHAGKIPEVRPDP
jgi:hypothetical protein